MITRPRYQGDIPHLYRRLAPIYDAFTDHELPHHREAVRRSAIGAGDVVLEVACGTGRATLEIARRLGDTGTLHAVDLTAAMLARARRRLAASSYSRRVTFGVADARSLPFPDSTYDCVYNAYMLDLISAHEIPGVLEEFKRVLRPGGRVILVNMSKDTPRKTAYEWLYEKGLLTIASGACRPVLIASLLNDARFEQIDRVYRRNRSWFFLNRLTGTEIVVARKPI